MLEGKTFHILEMPRRKAEGKLAKVFLLWLSVLSFSRARDRKREKISVDCSPPPETIFRPLLQLLLLFWTLSTEIRVFIESSSVESMSVSCLRNRQEFWMKNERYTAVRFCFILVKM